MYTLKDVSPEDFAAREEMKEQTGWTGKEKKTKGKVRLHDEK